MKDLARVVLRESSAFAVAAVFVAAVAGALPRLVRHAPDAPPPPAVGMTFPNPANLSPAYVNAVLTQHLTDGDAVLFGSSELAFHGGTAPHEFFPRACGRPILTIGRAGFQSLPILLTLTEVQSALSAKSDLNVILSPGWFAEFGTPSGAFLRYLKPEALRTIFARPDLPKEVRDAVAREITNHRDEFSGLYPDWLFPWWPALARRTPPRAEEPWPVLHSLAQRAPAEEAKSFDWDLAEAEARADQVKRAAGNPLGTDLDYFERYKDQLPKAVTPLDKYDLERKDLYALSTFLKNRGVTAKFIVQPVHRLVYRDLSAYDERMAGALAQLRTDGHRVVDLGAEPYDTALLQDSVHFGGYGWIKAQREICRR